MIAAAAAPRAVARPRAPTAVQVAALLAFALGVSSLAQAQPQITANYRDADIRAIIDSVSQITGKRFIVDPRVRAQVTVFSTTPLSPDAFYQLFVAMLEVHGFVPLESGNAIEIVPDANARTGQGADFVTQAVVLNNVGAVQLVPVLRPLLPQSAHLAAIQSANALLIADRKTNLDRITNIIRRLDTAGTNDVEVIALENASADEVVRMIGQLNTAAQASGGAPPVQAIADTRTNSILLSGAGPSRLQYRAMITHLDTPSAQGGDTLVMYLNYADAEDLAMKLQAQFGASGGSTRPSGGGGGGAAPAPGGEAAAVPGNGPVTIWADPGTNALVINAPERVRQDMLAVIKQIDIPRLQVQVDAIIVELTRKKAAELGVTWAIDGSDNNRAVGLTNFSSTTGGIVQLGTAASGESPSPNLIRDGLTLGLGHIRDGATSWAAIISALAGDADTNVVSTPTIVTLDNEEAEIRVGQEVPFVTGQYTSTGGNNNGNVNPFTTIQRQEVGTNLKIKPQINEGNGVKLVIEQETSSISGSASGAVDLVTNKRTITTSVFVDDGDILVLGGLSDDQLRQSEQRVPGLGKIPGLGWLFRARNTNHDKSDLMVFIRPTILKNRQDVRFQTNSKYQLVQELQRQMAQSPVRLMKSEPHPELPPFPEGPPEPDTAAPPPTDPTTESNGGQPR